MALFTDQLYLRAPAWGNPVEGWGSYMDVIMAPGTLSGASRGTIPSVQMPSGSGYISGHLLNQDMGGNGVRCNLFPLTGSANMQHKTFETMVKTLMMVLGRIDPVKTGYYYGVYYEVDASDPFLGWTNRGFKVDKQYVYAPSKVDIKIQVVKIARAIVDGAYNRMVTGWSNVSFLNDTDTPIFESARMSLTSLKTNYEGEVRNT